jgi:hypothetical protein
MSRKVHDHSPGLLELLGLRHAALVPELVQEIKSNRDFGQPRIDEQVFPTGAISVRVIWDKWEPVAHDNRSATILMAYQQALGKDYADRITLATGLTVPEGRASGILPFQVLPALRRGDPVTDQQCREAMIAEGASVLGARNVPLLCFATEAEAEASRARLAKRLPGSEPVWIITQQEAGVTEDWAGTEMP